MARYDPYDRGDNPWRVDIDRLDMPKSNPTAKAGAARVASPIKKKPPVVPTAPVAAPWAGRGPEVTKEIFEPTRHFDDAVGGPGPTVPGYMLDERHLLPMPSRTPPAQAIGDPGFRPQRPAADMQFGMGDPGFGGGRPAAPPTQVVDRQPGPQPGQLTATGDNPILRFLAGLFSGTANAR